MGWLYMCVLFVVEKKGFDTYHDKIQTNNKEEEGDSQTMKLNSKLEIMLKITYIIKRRSFFKVSWLREERR